MALPAEDDVRRVERLNKFRSDVLERLGNYSDVRFELLQSRAYFARTRALTFDRVVDHENHLKTFKSQNLRFQTKSVARLNSRRGLCRTGSVFAHGCLN